MKLKWVCAGKEISQEKRLPTDWEKMFASCISNTGRIPRLNKEKIYITSRKFLKIGQSGTPLSREFSKEELLFEGYYI